MDRIWLGAALVRGLAGLALLLSPAALRGQALFAHDAFVYGAGQSGGTLPLPGRDGGHGWTSPWIGVDPAFTGLGSWWPLDGSAADVGPLGAHGVEVNASYAGPAGLAWSTGSLALANGAHIELSAYARRYLSLTRGTVSAWVRTTDTSNKLTILSVSEGGANDRYAFFGIDRGRAALDVRGDLRTRGTQLRPNGNVSDGNWHHLAYTCAGNGGAKIYLDGVEIGSSDEGFIGYIQRPDAMYLGRTVNAGSPQWDFQGDIDDVALWGRDLTAAEVMGLALSPPISVVGVASRPLPELAAGSVGPHASFSATGLQLFGDKLVQDTNSFAARFMTTLIDNSNDGVFYISCLLRRDDRAGVIPGEVQFADEKLYAARLGWDASGRWTVGVNSNATGSVVMQDQVPYFVVVELKASSGSADLASLKAYSALDPVHTDPSQLSGAGAGQNQWTVQKSQMGNSGATAVYAVLQGSGPNRFELDELRIGPTWQSVTSYRYGQGCLGVQIDRAGRPLLGAPGFSLQVSGAAPRTPAFLLLGVNNQRWLGNLLPFDLAPLGAPGCSLLTALDAVLPVTTSGAGVASLPLTLPAVVRPGDPLFAQWVASDPLNTNPLPVGLSAGMVVQGER